jgi:hypothetical protein
MRNDKEIARELRVAGKSYNDIERQLNIPKSTLSGWFGGVDWSQTVRENLVKSTKKFHVEQLKKVSQDRGQKLRLIYERAENEAREEFELLKNNPLFISVIMAYWGEGDKRSKGRCSISNSDPHMLRLFSLFLEKVCTVPKAEIKAWILAYPDTNTTESLVYWSRLTGVWVGNFKKTIFIKGKSAKRRLPYGVCYVYISSTYLKRKILLWMTLLSQHLIKYAEK